MAAVAVAFAAYEHFHDSGTGGGPLLAAFPSADTPIAQAPATVADRWRPYGVTIIPSAHIFDGLPSMPRVVNASGSAISDADAQRYATDFFMRNAPYTMWLYPNNQGALGAYLGNPTLFNDVSGRARAQCDVFPDAMAVGAVDQTVQKAFQGYGITFGREQAVLVNHYAANCASPSTGSTRTTASTTVFVGHAVSDPLLGEVFFSDARQECSGGSLMAQLCSSV